MFCRLLAEEVVDAEDLLLGEHLVQPPVELDRRGVVGAERLLHDDPAPLDEARLGDGLDRGQGGLGRHGEVVQPQLGVPGQQFLGGSHRCAQGLGPRRQRDVVQPLGEFPPLRLVELARRELLDRLGGDLPVVVVALLATRHRDQVEALGQGALVRQVVDRGQQLALGQVARATEDHERRGVDRQPLEALDERVLLLRGGGHQPARSTAWPPAFSA